MKANKFSFLLLLLLSVNIYSSAQNPEPLISKGKKYNDGHDGELFLPLGDPSFADEAGFFKKGDPAAVLSSSDSSKMIGIPDFDGLISGFTSLGCGGSIILKFIDNAIVNIPGSDLYVFEVGKYIEPTNMEISKDGISWIDVGKIGGAVSEVDISPVCSANDIFNFVRLTDLKTDCTGKWPGADIDAVAAIGSAKRISFESKILFEFDKAVLKNKAKILLANLAGQINLSNIGKIIVEGHTDNTGSHDYNQKLSERRAKVVREFLRSKTANPNVTFLSVGRAETIPVSSNSTKEGQEMNRRVELILFPGE